MNNPAVLNQSLIDKDSVLPLCSKSSATANFANDKEYNRNRVVCSINKDCYMIHTCCIDPFVGLVN
jgi:hypothetical protein